MIDCMIQASDGDAGTVEQCYFDDLTWNLRYVTVKLKEGQPGRQVLIPIAALGRPNWGKRVIPVNLTLDQIRRSPTTGMDEPVSREYEIDLHHYYAWPGYWGETYYAPPGFGTFPLPFASEVKAAESLSSGMRKIDPHLRSTWEVKAFVVQATDGRIGHVDDFIIDDEAWALRYLVVNTRNWLPDRLVLVSPHWISKVNWDEMKVNVDLTREAIKESPAFNPAKPISPDYESKLRGHLQQPEPKEWVMFKFHAPPKTKVFVAGTFNNWNPTAVQLGYHGKRTYSALILLPLGTYEYKFIVNGEWCNGTDCTDHVPNVFGTTNNRLVVSRMQTHDVHRHTFARLPESEGHRLWSVPVGG
jgi:hypothetical protein